MDNKELQKTVNPIYQTAKGTLGLLNKAKDPDAMALMPLIGLDADLQEQAKAIPESIGLCYRTAQLARYEIYNTAALRSGAPNIVDLPSGYSPLGFRVSSAGLRVLLLMRKSVKDPGCFKIFHVQPEVEKILKMTGFDTLLF